MSECPSCGRFTGPYEACPYCGARLSGRTPLRILKYAALFFSIAGLVGLWFIAGRVQVPKVRIDQLDGMLNMAYVRIEGRVSEGPSYDPKAQSIAFYVIDKSAEELYVSAYRDAASELIALGRIPAVGDQISVVGNVRIRDDFSALYINAPQLVVITRTEPIETEIGKISPANLDQRVRVRGQVRQMREPYSGVTLITIRDATGEIEVAVSQSLIDLTGPLSPDVMIGKPIEVVANVSLYRETPQLIPASTADLTPITGSGIGVTEREVGSLTPQDEGQWAQLQGQIVQFEPFSKGVRFVIDDGTGQITALLWDTVYVQVPYSATLGVGAQVQVQGSISVYRGALEIVPEVPEDIAILVAAPPPEEATVVGLSTADAGRVVTLHGVLGPAEPFSKGVRYMLDDGTGEITLLLWSNVVDEAPAGLGPGAEVRVQGEISEYKGALELVPGRGSDIVVLGQGTLPTPTPATITPISALSAANEGQVVTVAGTLGDMEAFSKGVRGPLSDGSGEITLLLWQNVLDAFPGAARLASGTRVQVTGEVSVYNGALEIVPEAGGIVLVP